MRWEKDELVNIQALILSVDERNQLIGLELIQQGELWEGFAPLLTFLVFADTDRANIVETAKQILANMKPETQAHWNEVCSILHRTNFKKAKIQHFEKYITLFDGYVKNAPRFSPTYMHLGKKLINVLNNRPKGLEYLRKAANFNTKDHDANCEYAYYLDSTIENVDTIIKCYLRCLNLNSSFFGVHHNLGKAYSLKGDNELAIKTFREGLAKFPNRGETMIELSLVIKKKGDIAEARELLERALEIIPNSTLAHNNLAFLLWDSFKEHKLALKHIKKALKIKPNHGLYWHTMAEVYWYGLKKKKEALAALYKGKENDPNYKGGDAMIKELESI